MHRFYQNGRLCDVVLQCDGTFTPCHRLVLAASSVYFERMFLNDMSESRAAEVQIVGVASTALQRLVNFAYTSLLPVSGDTVLDTFEASDMLEFPCARLFCEQFIGESVDDSNCLSVLLYADAYSSIALYNQAMQCVVKHFQVSRILYCTTQSFVKVHYLTFRTPNGCVMVRARLPPLLNRAKTNQNVNKHSSVAFQRYS